MCGRGIIDLRYDPKQGGQGWQRCTTAAPLHVASPPPTEPSRKPKTVFSPLWATPMAAIICRPLDGMPSITMAHSFSSDFFI